MSINRVPEFPFLLAEWLDQIPRQQRLAPIYLAGTSGSGGGVGQPPGGFMGRLSQRFVAYDTDEFALSSGSTTLVDNLNHIREWLKPARWFRARQGSPIQNRIYVEPGVWTHTSNTRPLFFAGSYTPAFTSGSADHVDLIYLTTSGSLLISTSANTTPVYPGGTILPIWEVYVRASSGSYYDTDQGTQGYLYKDVRPFLNFGSSGSSAVDGSGVANALAIWSDTDTLTSDDVYYDGTNDVLLVGTPTIITGFLGRVQTVKTGGASGNTNVSFSNTATDAPFFTGAHAHGTSGSPTAVASGDSLVRLNGTGYGDTGWGTVAARIEAIADENFTDTTRGTYWKFSVTQPTTITLAEAFRVSYDSISIVGNQFKIDGPVWIDPSGASVGDALTWNGTKWVPGAVSGGTVDGTGAADQFAIWSDTDTLTSDSRFYYDSTENQVIHGVALHSGITAAGIYEAQDATGASIAVVGYGTGNTPLFKGYRSRGTSGSPTAVQSGDILFEFDGYGYDGSAWSGIRALIQGVTTENWTGSAQGTSWKWFATPNGATGTKTVMQVDTTGATLTQTPTSGGGVALTLTTGSHTAVTSELHDVYFNLARTVTFTHLSVPATQRAVRIAAPTYATSSSTDTITTAATFYISGAPAAGTGITITNSYALWVDSGLAQFDDGIQDATLTSGRIALVGANGRLRDQSNFTYSGGSFVIASAIDSGLYIGATSFIDSGSTLLFSGNFDLVSGAFIGLSSSAGRLVFTDAATDTIELASADVNVTGGNLTVGVANSADGTITGNRVTSGTNDVLNGLLLDRYSTGTAAAGLGIRIGLRGEDDGGTLRSLGQINASFISAAAAGYTGRLALFAVDSGASREGLRIDANGSATAIGFFGTTAATRPSAYTQTYSTATRTHSNITATAPSAYAGGANGYSTAAKAQEVRDATAALVTDMANVKQVLNQVIDDLQAFGLLA